jgi:hypothetical protein
MVPLRAADGLFMSPALSGFPGKRYDWGNGNAKEPNGL